jgi:uncharacterized membrane protein
MARYKTLSFAFVHMLVAFSVIYLMTGSLVLGGAVALIEPAVNTIAYYLHERTWERWAGKSRTPTHQPIMPEPRLHW